MKAVAFALFLIAIPAHAAQVYGFDTSEIKPGEARRFTVPAINVRGMSNDTARSIFRTAIKQDAGAYLLEIAP